MDTVAVVPHRDKSAPACNTLLEAALQFIARGWSVIPLHKPIADGCSCLKGDCNSVGKHPRIHNGLKGASSREATICGWWTRWPDANIGVVTGPGSGIFVLDVDGDDGQALLKAMEPLPETLRANTGRTGAQGERTGFHLYFTLPAGVTLQSSTKLLGQGLDVRAAGGYVVAPPSLHVSGLRYEWTEDGSAIAEPPTWLIAKASKPKVDEISTRENRFLHEGERDHRLFRLAAKWRRNGANQGEIYAHLRAVNSRLCKPPLADSQILKIAQSAAAYPPGGPDPLEEAWAKADAEGHHYSYCKFVALIRHLHDSRPGLPIMLPVVRIGKLIGCDRTLIGRHRKRAIEQGLIQESGKYIAHERATRFKVISP
jgi:putative DNA primase/helicase